MSSFKGYFSLINEDAETTKSEIVNNLIRKELGFQVFKNKNKPENKNVIDELKFKYTPIIDQLENIVRNHNPRDKNLIDLTHLVRLYQPNIDFNVISNDYRDYISIPAHLSNFLKDSKTYQDFAEKVHSLVKSQGGEKHIGTSDDPNKKYEDENIIVFLANTGDPESSEQNCLKYGKGSSLCISTSSSSHYYNFYRWEKKLTTYFIWLKEEQKYILVDVYEDFVGKKQYLYNNIQTDTGENDNIDVDATEKEIIELYPVLEKAFQNNVFVPLPIEGDEKEFYEEVYNKKSILEVEKLKHKKIYASLKEVADYELKQLNDQELKEVLKVLIEKNKELPHDLLEKFPSLNKRYWDKIRKKLLITLENGERKNINWINGVRRSRPTESSTFQADEYYLMWNDKEIFELAKEKLPNFNEFLSYYDNMKKSTKLNELIWVAPFPFELPLLEEVGNVVIDSLFGEISLPKLKTAGNFLCPYKLKLNLPSLETVERLTANHITKINCSSLRSADRLYLEDVEELHLPKLNHLNVGHFVDVSDLDLPELETSPELPVDINAKYSKRINLPKVENITGLYSKNCKEFNMPLLKTISGFFFLESDNLEEVILPNLQTWQGGSGPNTITAEKIILPQLNTIGVYERVTFKVGSVLEMPSLRIAKSIIIDTGKIKRINFDLLRWIEELAIYSDSVETLNLPNLKTGSINATSVKIAMLPELKETTGLFFRQLKKIIIDKKLNHYVTRNTFPYGPVELIEPSTILDESLSFKNFFYLTNI
jgi:hypothetical protein